VLPVSVAAKVGVTPTRGLLFASKIWIETVAVEEPSATTGPTAVILEVACDTGPASNTTVPPVRVTGDARDKVFVSATVDVNVQVETPVVALELEHTP
jgi:hypothetical protein